MLYSNIYNKIHTILDIDDATDLCILRGHPGFVQIPNWTVIAHCYVAHAPMACPGPANAPGNACARLPHASERPFGHRSLGKECRSRERNLVYCIQLTYVLSCV